MKSIYEKSLPMAERYRPKRIEDFILDPIIEKKIKCIIDEKNVPNMIFTGKSGVGKTSAIRCIFNSIYKRSELNDSVIELNASDERGIKVVNDIIINFCKRKIYYHEDSAQHKLLILDEADNQTEKAQKLINGTLEKYPSTRFVFICNDSSEIIEAIQSRCIIIKFTNLPVTKYIERIENICKLESINYELDALNYLYKLCQSDIRQVLNTIELTSLNYPIITIENIVKICDIPPLETLTELYNAIIKKDVITIFNIIKLFQSSGYYSLDIIYHFIKYIKYLSHLHKKNDDIDIKIIKMLSLYSYKMNRSTISYLQLTGAFLSCM